MSFINKTLAQANPGAVLTDLYVAPPGANTIASVTVCNLGVFADTYRISIALAGAADHPKQYIQYDKVLPSNTSETVSNIYLRAGDVIRVYASVADISFTAMGTESA